MREHCIASTTMIMYHFPPQYYTWPPVPLENACPPPACKQIGSEHIQKQMQEEHIVSSQAKGFNSQSFLYRARPFCLGRDNITSSLFHLVPVELQINAKTVPVYAYYLIDI